MTMHLASLKEELLESEFFGHKKGSFSGALENRNGYLAEVGEGTLFLDEIGELSLESQKKLLYLLEEKLFTPVGSHLPLPFKGRIIMATNRNLSEMVAEKKFREDLFSRISTFHIRMPSLSDDKQNLKRLIDEIFQKLKIEHLQPYAHLSQESYEYLMNNKWRSNIRELKKSLEYALLMSEKNQIQIKDFPGVEPQIANQNFQVDEFLLSLPDDFNESLEQFERMYLNSRFLKFNGKVNETARLLGVSKTTLIQKAKKYQINTLKMRSDASQVAA